MLLFEQVRQPQELRDYQAEAVAAIRQSWQSGRRAPLIAVATGGGKTTIIAELLRQSIDPASERAIVFAHTEEIIHQIHERVANQFAGALDGYYGGQRGIGIVMADQDDVGARIIVATRQSLHPARMRRILAHGAIKAIVIDEAHHAGPGTTYQDIIAACQERNGNLYVAGVTATPARGDGHALESTFSHIAYQWLIPDGIERGYLVPVTRMTVKTRVDAQRVKTSRGDYVQGQLVSVLEAANWLDLCADAYRQHIASTGRQALAFFPAVDMSQMFAERLSADGIAAAHIDGNTPKDVRRAVLRDYKARKLALVSNMAVLTEGFDAPETAAILLARPTKSQTLFTQIVGRGLRPFPGKTDCLLVDMTVSDTRALEVGTLLGKMKTCYECEAQYHAGKKACPMCGAIPAKGAGAGRSSDWGEEFTGSVTMTEIGTLFEQAFAAWYTGGDGFLSCALPKGYGAYLIVPPVQDEYYRLLLIPEDRNAPPVVRDSNEDLAALMLVADAKIRQYAARTADKVAAWRSQPASLAQITLLRQLGVKPDTNISKGAAAQLITHTMSVKRFLRHAGVR